MAFTITNRSPKRMAEAFPVFFRNRISMVAPAMPDASPANRKTVMGSLKKNTESTAINTGVVNISKDA